MSEQPLFTGDPVRMETPFDRFWAAWPKHGRKRGKKIPLARWTREKLDERVDHVLAVLKVDKAKWAEDNNRYVPAPEVWINKRQWDVELKDLTPKRDTTSHPLTRGIVEKSDVKYPEKQKPESIADKKFACKWRAKHNKRQHRRIVTWAIKRTGKDQAHWKAPPSFHVFVAYKILAKVIREQNNGRK